MKKILYSFLLFAVALVSTAALVSCGDDDDDAPKGQSSFTFQYFISEDLQKLADVTVTGIPQLTFTTKTTLNLPNGTTCPGYESQQVKLTGTDAENANVNVTFKVKPNWKEILGDQKSVKLYYTYKEIDVTSDGTIHSSTPNLTAGMPLATDSEEELKRVENYINTAIHTHVQVNK